jgi:hypothetical protein
VHNWTDLVVPALCVWSGIFMVIAGLLMDKLHEANQKLRRVQAYIREN